MTVQLMSKSGYARHRGCDEKAVRKAVAEGRISLINGKIDAAVADIQWAANSRARASRGQAKQLALVAASVNDEPANSDDYMFNRNRREAAEAERAELSLAEDKGQLIRVDAVKAALANVFSATRDVLLQIPARLGPQLAAESDPAKAQTMLHAEIHQALQLLAGATDRMNPDTAVTT